MELHLDGQVSPSLPAKQYYGRESVHLILQLKDGVLRSKKHRKYSVSINPSDSHIIDGQDLINHMMVNWISMYKKCWTCQFRVLTQYNKGHVKKHEKFPYLTLVSEELSYTLRRGKPVAIHQTYYDDTSLLGIRTWITVNRKPAKSMYVDFNKFKDLDQLNKRLATILTFS
jgi:hypothetical protein